MEGDNMIGAYALSRCRVTLVDCRRYSPAAIAGGSAYGPQPEDECSSPIEPAWAPPLDLASLNKETASSSEADDPSPLAQPQLLETVVKLEPLVEQGGGGQKDVDPSCDNSVKTASGEWEHGNVNVAADLLLLPVKEEIQSEVSSPASVGYYWGLSSDEDSDHSSTPRSLLVKPEMVKLEFVDLFDGQTELTDDAVVVDAVMKPVTADSLFEPSVSLQRRFCQQYMRLQTLYADFSPDVFARLLHIIRCPYCDERLFNVLALVDHVKEAHEQDSLYLCPNDGCKRTAASSQLILNHLLRSHMHKVKLGCAICGKSSADFEQAKSHLDSHPAACLMCSTDLEHGYLIDDHFKQQHLHESENSFCCCFCSVTSTTQHSFQYHLRQHFGMSRFKCKFCSEWFMFRERICQHMNEKHMEKGRVVECPICSNYWTTRALSLLLHWQNACSQLRCDICRSSYFSSASALSAHQRHCVPPNDLSVKNSQPEFEDCVLPSFMCNFPSCEYFSRKENALHLHVSSQHHALQVYSRSTGRFGHGPLKAFICEDCGMLGRDAYMIHRHKIRKHGIPSSHTCERCDYSFVTRAELVMHTKQLHPPSEGEESDWAHKIEPIESAAAVDNQPASRPSPSSENCELDIEICEAGASNSDIATSHSPAHKSSKSPSMYTCDKCNYVTASSSQYRRHQMSKIHRNRTPNVKSTSTRGQCPICGFEPSKSTGSKGLSRHMFTHYRRGEKIPEGYSVPVHQCPLCAHIACDDGHLRRHMKTHVKRGETLPERYRMLQR